MIRFVLKSALLVGLAATVLPLASPSGENGAPGVDLFGVAAGIREAAADLGGFCDRAPQACTAAGEVASFTADRIGAGLSIGYDYLNETLDAKQQGPAEPQDAATRIAESPDPVRTGTIEPFGPPRPYMPPRPLVVDAPQAVATPTPAPRT